MSVHHPKRHRPSAIRTVRLDDESLRGILDSMDVYLGEGVEPKRTEDRYNFRSKGCMIHMQQPGDGSPAAFLVPTRNISAGGMSFLHGGYVHTGTRCLVQLVNLNGSWLDVRAQVVRCRHVQGKVHEVGVAFDRHIKPEDFCTDAIRYRILLAEDDESMARLTLHHFEQINCETTWVTNGRDALEFALGQGFDIVFMDTDMPVMDGLEATRKLREAQYSGPIIAMTSLARRDDQKKCLLAGFDTYVGKPIDRRKIQGAMEILREAPLVSTLDPGPGVDEMIDSFLESLPKAVRRMEQALHDGNLNNLEEVTRKLKGSGTSFGFEPITGKAAMVEYMAQDHAPLNELRKEVGELVKLCLQARGSRKTAPHTPERPDTPAE